MKIKEITLDDALYEKTLELRTNVISIPFGFPPPTREQEKSGSLMFVAIEENKIVGFAMVTPSDDKTSIRARQVSVLPEKQKRGIGRLLMEQAEAAAKRLGYKELCLYAHTDSYQFYVKLDYVVRGEWQTLENGLKTILMSKKL